MSKTNRLEEIPKKILRENLNILATFLNNDIHTCIKKEEFPNILKTTDITPALTNMTNQTTD